MGLCGGPHVYMEFRGKFGGLIFYFYHMGPWDGTQILKLSNKHLYPPSLFVSCSHIFFHAYKLCTDKSTRYTAVKFSALLCQLFCVYKGMWNT